MTKRPTKHLTAHLKKIAALCVVFHTTACQVTDEVPKENYSSTLIQDVMIYDGSGGTPYMGDIRIRGSKIIAIGILEPKPQELKVPGMGLVAAPGFIDVHSHHPEKFDKEPAPKSVLAQGITTVIAGVDGKNPLARKTNTPVKELMADFNANPAAVNIGYYSTHNSIRYSVMGDDYQRPATREELAKMLALVQDDMEAGALGLSTGLEYEPGLYSETSEVIELTKVAAKYGGSYSTHIRSEDLKVFSALEEFITIARETGVKAHISHAKLAMFELWGLAPRVINTFNEARSEGLKITADIYPYDGWKAPMRILLPNRDYDNLSAYDYALSAIAPSDRITITTYDADPSLIGKTLKQIAAEKGVSPQEQMRHMLKVALKQNFYIFVIGRNVSSEDQKEFLKWPYTVISSDGGVDDLHPRGQGSFPRVIHSYVTQEKLFPLEEAIRKMTSLSASILGLDDRGLLKEGYAADIILFDKDTFRDHATFESPVKYSTGLAYAWVNGEMVWHKGEATLARPGQVLKHTH